MSRPRPVRMPTRETLAEAALFYLSRYAASEASLRRVLRNRLRRAAAASPEFGADPERLGALQQAIEDIIDGHKKGGALDDAAFAEMKVNSLRRSGRSRRYIQQSLTQKKGVAAHVVQAAFAQTDGEDDATDAELKAARTFARRRKLGPFRATGAGDADRQRKDIAALARAGFDLRTARAALAVTTEDDFNEYETT